MVGITRPILKRSENFSRFSPIRASNVASSVYGFGFLVQLHGNRVILPSLLRLFTVPAAFKS